MTIINLDSYHRFVYSPLQGHICPYCQGTGMDRNYRVCLNCEGKGYVLKKNNVFVNNCLSDISAKKAIFSYPDLNFLSNFKQNYSY